MEIKGNTILITGGGSGIGRGLAEAFHALGNKVIIAGRRENVLRETAAANPGMEYAMLDTSADSAAIATAASDLIRRFPDLNVVINNAGVMRVLDFAVDMPVDENAMAEEINTNIYGVLRMTNAFLPHLKTKAPATIINLSSGLAFAPLALYPVYCATKAFVHSFSMSLRHQLRRTGVHVIELAPPWVATDLQATHETHPALNGMSPMPLPDFITAAMEELVSGREELPVANAKFLYSAGVSDRATAIFAQMNQ